jgi:hypothetical protein
MKVAVYILFCAVFVHAGFGENDSKAWQLKAIAKYPSLGVDGSDFNKRFVAAYSERQKTSPTFFKNSQWPLLLADEIAGTQASIFNERLSKVVERSTDSSARAADFTGEDWVWAIWAIGAAILWWMMNCMRRFNRKARILSSARNYIASANQRKALPTVNTDLILKGGESAFYSAPTSLLETRAVRQYQSGFAGFRVAKGIYIGGSRGRSFSTQEWTQIDSGKLVITNKRLIFAGNGSDRTVNISRVVHVNPMKDAIEISCEGRQKGMAFTTNNSLIVAAIIRICAEASDPLDLTDTPLDFQFR